MWCAVVESTAQKFSRDTCVTNFAYVMKNAPCNWRLFLLTETLVLQNAYCQTIHSMSIPCLKGLHCPIPCRDDGCFVCTWVVDCRRNCLLVGGRITNMAAIYLSYNSKLCRRNFQMNVPLFSFIQFYLRSWFIWTTAISLWSLLHFWKSFPLKRMLFALIYYHLVCSYPFSIDSMGSLSCNKKTW